MLLERVTWGPTTGRQGAAVPGPLEPARAAAGGRQLLGKQLLVAAPPQLLAQQHDARSFGQVLFPREGPAEQRLDAQNREGAFADEAHGDHLGGALPPDGSADLGENGDVIE